MLSLAAEGVSRLGDFLAEDFKVTFDLPDRSTYQ